MLSNSRYIIIVLNTIIQCAVDILIFLHASSMCNGGKFFGILKTTNTKHTRYHPFWIIISIKIDSVNES